MGNNRMQQMDGLTTLWALTLLACQVSAGFIDMDTPLKARTTRSLIDKSVYDLVRILYACLHGGWMAGCASMQ